MTKSTHKLSQALKLRGKGAVYIDWANVYGWRSSLKKDPDPRAIFDYFSSYKEIEDVRFYYGQDSNKQSEKFLKEVKRIGFNLFTKPVKHIVVGSIENTVIKKKPILIWKSAWIVLKCSIVSKHLSSYPVMVILLHCMKGL